MAAEKDTPIDEKGASQEQPGSRPTDEKRGTPLPKTPTLESNSPNNHDFTKEPSKEGENQYHIANWKFALIIVGLALSVLTMALDNSIIATAIPRITDHFHALDDVGWYGSSYMLTLCATPLLYGKIYAFYSLKWVYIGAVVIFEIGSLLCGAAPTSTALIIGRAIAGLGAAGIFTGAILIIAATVPLHKRPVYNGIVGAMYGIAGVAGPLLGGALTDRVSWRWCFYINLPFGAITIAFVVAFLQLRSNHNDRGFHQFLREIDIPGNIMFMPSVICVLLALQWGGSKYDWSNGKIIALFVVFGVLFIGFAAIQVYSKEHATVPVHIVQNRSVCGTLLFCFCLGAGFFLIIFYLPIWFQAIKGASAVHSSIMNLPLILSMSFVSATIGIAVTLTRQYVPFVFLSSIFMAVGSGLITTFTPSTGHPIWMGYQVLYGIGPGLGIQQPIIVIQNVLPPSEVPVGTALVMLCQALGGAIFMSVGQNIFTNQLIKYLGQVVPELNPRFVLDVGATELRSHVPPELIPRVMIAYNKALMHSFYAAVAMGALSILGAFAIKWKKLKTESEGKEKDEEAGRDEKRATETESAA